MQIYLDTNILVFLLNDPTELSREVTRYLQDYENQFLISSICVKEIIYLIKAGKTRSKLIKKVETDLFNAIDNFGIQIVPPTRKHLEQMVKLDIDQHLNKDPNDYMIVAQAISDKIPLISADRDFTRFTDSGLQFIFNRR